MIGFSGRVVRFAYINQLFFFTANSNFWKKINVELNNLNNQKTYPFYL